MIYGFLLCLFIIAFLMLFINQLGLYKELKSIGDQVYTDELTKLYNRKYLEKRISDKVEEYYFVLADIDKFKSVNDTYGHIAGDHVLKYFSKMLSTDIYPKADYVIRLGGEEFLILFEVQKYSSVDEVYEIVDSFRDRLAKKNVLLTSELIHDVKVESSSYSIINKEEKFIKVTASFGIGYSMTTKQLDEKIKEADISLYKAKKTGRNKVVIN
jgi:diguanylate cyclase (GGDEF)-like protein